MNCIFHMKSNFKKYAREIRLIVIILVLLIAIILKWSSVRDGFFKGWKRFGVFEENNEKNLK